MIGAGVAVVCVGVIYDLDAVQSARDRLAKAETPDAYNGLVSDFRSKRNVGVGLLAGGALLAGVGIALKLTIFDSAPQVTASIDHDGGLLAIGWQR